MTIAPQRQLFIAKYLIDVGAMPNPVSGLILVFPDVANPDGYRDATPADYARDGAKMWEWNPAKVHLFLTDAQKAGRTITGFYLDREVASLNPLGPNVGEFLRQHPEEIVKIPGADRARTISFMLQKYRNSSGSLCVRYLCWNSERWDWRNDWLDGRRRDENPAAVLRE